MSIEWATTLRADLRQLPTNTKIEVATLGSKPTFEGELEHVGEDFIVVGAWRVQLAHIVGFRLQRSSS